LFSANSTTMRSVPADTKLAATFTNAKPSRGVGTGTSSTMVLPSHIFCNNCFMKLSISLFTRWSRYGGVGRVVPQGRIETRRLLDQRSFIQELVQQTMEMMDTVLALDRVPPLTIDTRRKIALDVFTQLHIFLLDVVAEGNAVLQGIPGLGRAGSGIVPLKDGQGLIMAERDDDIDLHVARIRIEHEVGKDPVIMGLLVTFELGEDAAGGIFGADRSNGCILRGVIAEGIHAILLVVHFLEQGRVGDRDVIALEVVIDIDFPVGIDHIVAVFH